MLRLDLTAEPRWLDLGHGVRFRAAPLTTALMVAGAAGAAERRDLRMTQVLFLDLAEKFHVVGIGRCEAAFDVIDAEFVQAFGDADFARAGKGNALALRPVAERGVVDGHFLIIALHSCCSLRRASRSGQPAHAAWKKA